MRFAKPVFHLLSVILRNAVTKNPVFGGYALLFTGSFATLRMTDYFYQHCFMTRMKNSTE